MLELTVRDRYLVVSSLRHSLVAMEDKLEKMTEKGYNELPQDSWEYEAALTAMNTRNRYKKLVSMFEEIEKV